GPPRQRPYLERSQLHYAEAFRLTPSDWYVGINAAAKAVLLGRLDDGRAIARAVLALVDSATDGSKYYATVTHAEARLILVEVARAVELYKTAAILHLTETGNIEGTLVQAKALAAALGLPADDVTKLIEALPTAA